MLQRNAEHTSRTWPRSQRCAGSASIRGCQSNETVTSGVETGRGNPCILARRFPVCRSGTFAIRSEPRARASAVEKPPTITAISRSSPSVSKAASIGPRSRPRRETLLCLPGQVPDGIEFSDDPMCPSARAPMRSRSRVGAADTPAGQAIEQDDRATRFPAAASGYFLGRRLRPKHEKENQ